MLPNIISLIIDMITFADETELHFSHITVEQTLRLIISAWLVANVVKSFCILIQWLSSENQSECHNLRFLLKS